MVNHGNRGQSRKSRFIIDVKKRAGILPALFSAPGMGARL